MSEFLDELARSMAKPMPRRRALRAIGSALITVAVPAALARPARASMAVPHACTGCGVEHGAGCVLNKTCGRGDMAGFPVCCRKAGYFGRFTYGPAGGHCAQAGGSGGLDPPGGLACCCPAGSSCGTPPGEPVCVQNCRTKLCGLGKKCCGADQECVQFQFALGGKTYEKCAAKCEPGTRRCKLNLDCCPSTQHCCSSTPGDMGICCDPEQVCVRAFNTRNEYARLCRRKCEAPQVRCNFICCDADKRAYRKIKDGRIRCHCVKD